MPPLPNHPWTRLWLPDEQASALTRGYSPEQAGEDSWIIREDYQTLADLADVPCLILLGEPGMGKTTALLDEQTRLEADGVAVAFHDLKTFVDGADLLKGVFSEDAAHLFLDSLDEGRMVVDRLAATLPPRLKTYLKKHPGAHFRITCRSAEWPSSLTEKLVELFGKENVQVRLLCPLKRSDVASAGSAINLDPDDLLREIDALEAEALAAKPVTLDMLLRIKQEHGTLPSRLSDLYARAMPLLAKDPNRDRQEQGWTGAIEASHRVVIARRIAVLSVLGQRPFIHTTEQEGDEASLALSDITRPPAQEPNGSDTVDITREAVREVLGCGLFRGHGDGRVGWAHQTYAEYLAAEAIARRELPAKQVVNLITAPGADAGRIAPQMRDFAGWLISLMPHLTEPLIAANPDAFLRSSVALADDETKKRVAKAYLEALQAERIEAGRFDYKRLANPDLNAVLRPVLSNPTVTYHALYEAITIARDCACSGVWDDLLAVAQTAERGPGIRGSAIVALAIIDDTGRTQDLVPFLQDDHDHVRGAALEYLWPEHVPVEAALAALRPPMSTMIGFYSYFVRKGFAEGLSDEDLPKALRWMAEFIDRHPAPIRARASEHDVNLRHFGELAKRLWIMAAVATDERDVLDDTVEFVGALIRNPEWIWTHINTDRTRLWASEEARQSVARRVILSLPEVRVPQRAAMNALDLLQPSDQSWMLEELQDTADENVRNKLIPLLPFVRDRNNEALEAALYDAWASDEGLKEYCPQLFGYIELGSPQERDAREAYDAARRRCETEQHQQSLEETAHYVAKALAKAADGDVIAWTWVVHEVGPDHGLRQAPHWRYLDDEARHLADKAAKQYLRNGDPNLEAWWPGQGFYWPAFAGLVALDHLAESIDNLPPDQWKKWAPVLIAYDLHDLDAEGRAKQLAARCHAAVPDVFEARILERLRALAQAGQHLSLNGTLKGVWSPGIAEAVAAAFTYPAVLGHDLEEGLRRLLLHEHPFAEAMVRAAIDGRFRGEKRLTILRAAFNHDAAALWDDVWQASAEDTGFRRRLLNSLASDDTFSLPLSEPQLAELYQAARTQLQAEQPVPGHAYRTSDGFPSRILHALAQHGTAEACATLERFAVDGDAAARIALIRCREERLSKTWRPLAPGQVLGLFERADRRAVRSGQELLDVLEESLERYQEALHGPGNHIDELWNQQQQHKQPDRLWPKDEVTFCRSVHRHLLRDIKAQHLIINREVELRVGERTDIHVNAIDRATGATLTAVIEAKGCWNRELLTAMEKQLADRYLASGQVDHGIYLVGRFQCPEWSEDDETQKKRKAKSAKQAFDLKALQRTLTQDADNLSRTRGKDIRAFVVDAAWRRSR